MGFFSGRVTFVRFRVGGGSPLPFGDEHLERVEARAIGREPAGSADGVSAGWAGGEHLLDLTFGVDKNVVDDALHLGLRIDSDPLPGDLLRAYTQIELAARAADNPSGRPTKAQRQEAKEAAKIRLEAESADGRFRRRKLVPVLWDGRENVLYVGTTAVATIDRLRTLFRETFDRDLEPISAGSLAMEQAGARGEAEAAGAIAPLALFDGLDALNGYGTVAWADSDPSLPDYLGNEFLLWLWHSLQHDGDIVALGDGSEATVMVAKTLTLDCPRGETGRDSLTGEGPTRQPEALRALQAGKLPRKAGLIVVRHGSQYELTLQAETLAVTGAALPKVEGPSGPAEARVARVESLRQLAETLDLLLDAFGRRRLGAAWAGDLGRIRDWLRAA